MSIMKSSGWNRMDFKSKFNIRETDINNKHYDIAFIGKLVDERGCRALDFSQKKTIKQVEVIFNVKTKSFEFDGKKINSGVFKQIVGGARKILVESTSLGIPELFYLFRMLRNLKQDIYVSVLYVEPVSYLRSHQGDVDDVVESYYLSDEFNTVSIPGAEGRAGESNCVVLCQFGYEGHRFLKIFEPYNADDWQKIALFGVPAYQTEWDHISLKNNLSVLDTSAFSGIYFSGANDVSGTYRKIHGIYTPFSQHDMPFIIIPLGTKPQAIAAILFVVVNHNDLSEPGIIYDHPSKLADRTSGVQQINLYSFTL